MKNITTPLKNHLGQEVTTLCTCWKAIRTDGQVYGFTDLDIDITFEGVTYLSTAGYTPTAITTSSELNVDDLQVEAIITHDLITEADLYAGKWDYAEIDFFQLNYQDLTQGKMGLRRGWLGEVSAKNNSFVAEHRSLTQKLQQSIGRVIAPGCDAVLGDTRCALDLAAFTFAGVVETVTSRREFDDSSLTQDDAYFDYGLVTWVTGDNAGLKMEVKTYLVGSVILQLPMPYEVQVGDTYSIVAGCNKTTDHCKNKFVNYVNYQGYPDVPGNDSLMRAGTE